ncbi:helix-turn-helix domain-containing protein [Streptomyces venezuelae]|uniref:helix-turn-helix domain-containing protein n=1 Tax=Streptomyces venezuelae TaxID=54571 RepID=UPI00331B0D84
MSQDTAGPRFAGLLRELKDRSGLSYGTLAKRLHMSPSTLHRYCSGEVVPADYAPVERLARLCKASPEELLALHRDWVRADTNRRRRNADTHGTGEGATAAAAGTGTPVPERAETAETVPEAAAEPAEAAEAVPELPPEPAEVAETAADVAEVTAAAAEPSPAPSPARRARPRGAVLAGIAVTVVAAVTALAGVLPLDAGPADRGTDVRNTPAGAAGRSPGEEQTPGGPPGPTPSGSPSPSASSSPSAPAASPDAAPDAPAAGNGTGGSDAGGDTAAGTPVKVTTRPHTWEAPCGQHYLIDKPPAQVGPPPVEGDAPAWVAAAGAVPAGEQYVTLTLQGSGPDTVVLDGMTVRTVAKRAPLPWNDYAMGYPGVGCGAGVPTRSFDVALDSARPAVAPVPGQRGFPFSVSESEPEVFHVKAVTSAHDVSWYLELSWSSGSRHGTLKIDHNGRPFRTSGRGGRPGYEFPLGGDGWVTAGTVGR